MNDVVRWLTSIGLEQYADTFADNDIDFSLLTSLDHEVLQSIGVKSAGHRMKMLKAADALVEEHSLTGSQNTQKLESIPQPSSGEAEHRQLTVMFCDLADSTALSGRLNTEAFRDVILAYQESCTRCVERYEGYVARVFGDGMLVYFGYPLAHEDEAQRAIHAGLEILDGLDRLNSSEQYQGLNLAVRIGIATGPVVVGDIIGNGAAQESTVLGETPNVAARLQSLAGSNQIIVSPATKNLAAGEFHYRSLGEKSLKGIEQPVVAWCIVGERDYGNRFDADRGQRISPLVGREEERDILTRRWQRAASGTGQVVMVCGEAGIGKSRLCRGLREHLQEQQHIELNYQCSPFHISSALYPVINQLERAAKFAPDDDPEAKLDKLEQLLSQSTDEIGSSARLIADLLSLPGQKRYGNIDISSIQQKDQTLQVLVRLLDDLSQKQPVLMVFEDLHWIDPTTLEFLDMVVEKIPEIPVMLLATHRPDFSSAWTGEAQVSSISLNKLDSNNCTALVEGVTGGLSLPPEVLNEIISKTDGVPLFIEELTKTVLESGLHLQENHGYVLAQPLTSLAIPSTLQDSLMARLDRLASVKEIAQIGAVIGREFGHELILAVAGFEDSVLTEGLEKLAAAGLVMRRGTPPLAHYIFKHALIQEISYASLLKSRRQQFHAKISEVLVERFPGLIETQPEIAAQHFAEAGLISQAVEYWHRAANLASSRAAPEEAYNHLGFALDGLKQLDDSEDNRRLRLDLLGQRVTPTIATSSYGSPQMVSLIDDAMSVYASLDDVSPKIFPIHYARWTRALVGGRAVEGPGISNEVLDEARRQKDELMIILGNRLRGCALVMVGEPGEGLRYLELALRECGASQSDEIGFTFGQDSLAGCLAYGAIAHGALGNFSKMYEFVERAINRAEVTKNPLTLAYVYSHVSVLFSEIRDFVSLSRTVSLLGGVLHEHPIPNWIPVFRYSQAVLNSDDLNSNLVQEDIRRSMEMLERTGFLYWRPIFEANLARVYLGCGETEQAGKAIENGNLIVDQGGDSWGAPELARLQADLMLASNAPVDDIDRAYLEALDSARNQPNKYYELRTACGLAKHYKNTERVQAARELLQSVCESVTEPCEMHDYLAAKDLLSQFSN